MKASFRRLSATLFARLVVVAKIEVSSFFYEKFIEADRVLIKTVGTPSAFYYL